MYTLYIYMYSIYIYVYECRGAAQMLPDQRQHSSCVRIYIYIDIDIDI